MTDLNELAEQLKNSKVSEDKYTVQLIEDPETGDLIMPLPSELLNQMGWDFGDDLLWEVLDNGNVSITKKVEQDG